MPTCNRCAKPFDGAGETCGPCQDYTDRREAKADRYRGFSENAGQRSAQAFAGAHRIADQIPMGQPILVGHHSEGRARADRRRIDNGMRRGIDEGKRADHWERRADAVEDDKSIRSDDPAAVVKLRDKIAELEAKRDKMKRINSLYRKGDVEALAALDLDYEVLKVKVDAAYSWEKAPFPGYAMTNLGGNIRRYKGRLKEAEAQAGPNPPRRLRCIQVKYAGPCADCGVTIEKGATALYERATRSLFGYACGHAETQTH